MHVYQQDRKITYMPLNMQVKKVECFHIPTGCYRDAFMISKNVKI